MTYYNSFLLYPYVADQPLTYYISVLLYPYVADQPLTYYISFLLYPYVADQPLTEFSKAGKPFDERSLGRIFSIASVKDVHVLEVIFPLPSLNSFYRDKVF